MTEQSEQKFMELSPVMELIFSQLTNMVKYLDLYANDIEAVNLEQYEAAKKGLMQAIHAFEEIYGVPATTEASEEESNFEEEDDATDEEEILDEENNAQGFASGNDELSLQKAKQAVEELKTLFADMKKKDEDAQTAQPVVPTDSMAMPVAAPVSAPAMQVAPPVMQPQQPTQPPVMPTPMAPAAVTPQQDASEIDSILAELRKLQNKGAQQL